MRPLTLAFPVALLSLVTACGTSSQPVDLTTAPPTTEPEPTTAAAPTTPGPTGSGAPSAGGAAQVLSGSVPASDPFKISLVDDKGAPVTTLKAGSYQIKIKDPSKIHNFHLKGPGVDVKTDVVKLEEITWPVTLKAGTYTYICDPHPGIMEATFTVT